MASYTKEQEQIVLKTLSYKSHQYYEVLSVEKTCSEGEIKKSYRKLAIKLHPDKNPHPRSSEAFKFLNKAWGVLSDPNKKTIYDQTGQDPDSRGMGGGGASSGGTSFARRGPGGASPFGGGADVDDIFNLFFGGGRPQGAQTFTFGGNGFQFQSFGGGGGHPFFEPNVRQRRTHPSQQRQRGRSAGDGDEEEASFLTTLRHLAPILIFLLIPILSALFSDNTPEYSFTQTRKFNTQRVTPRHHIPFYVTPNFKEANKLDTKQLKNFDKKVENLYVQDRRNKCSREQVRKNELMDEAQGFFFTDYARLEQAENMAMPNCEVLRNLNLL